MKRALMVAAVMVVSAVLWGEEPPAPQAVEQEKEDVTPLLREEKVEEKKEEQKEKPVAEEIFSTNERKKKGEKEKKLFFRGDIGFTWVSGNGSSYKNDTLAAYFNMSTTWNDNIAKIILKYDQKILPRLSDQNQSQAEIYQTNRIDLNFDYYLANRWEFFSFTEMESDPTKKLTYRFGVASGIKFVLFRNQYWLFDLGVAPKFEFTTYVDGPQRLKEFRSSSRVKMVFTLHEFVEFGGAFYYIPNMLDFFNDYRYELRAEIKFYYFLNDTPTQSVDITFAYNRQYNSKVVFDVQKLDQSILTTIGVNF